MNPKSAVTRTSCSVLRDVDTLGMADIEKKIKELAVKGRDGKLTVEDLTGGNFTITNGGVFGSLMSTPIINPPQSAILGMHAIKPGSPDWHRRLCSHDAGILRCYLQKPDGESG